MTTPPSPSPPPPPPSSSSCPVPIPSLDHPFGFDLWFLFDRVFTAITGSPAADFRYVPGSTPMATATSCFAALVSYYAIMFGGRELMRHREPFVLKKAFIAHNFLMSSISAVLLVLFVEQLWGTLWRRGLFYAICDHDGGWTQPLLVLYYLNYLVKYVEFVDTAFLVLKKKPLTFLHTYHHGATALLCYTQLIGSTAVSWVPITLNLSVHVVMYWYYFQNARGVRIWWKKYITIFQIVQFIIDLLFVYFATWTFYASTYYPWLPHVGKCAGKESAAICGVVILTSYLFLFVSFYIATYTIRYIKGPADKKDNKPSEQSGNAAPAARPQKGSN